MSVDREHLAHLAGAWRLRAAGRGGGVQTFDASASVVGDALVVEIARFKGDGVLLELRGPATAGTSWTGTWRLSSADAAAARPVKVEMAEGRLRLSPSGFANAERWELARVAAGEA